MAITLAEQHQLASDGDFLNRVRQAACTIAFEVLDEVQGTMTDEEMLARNSLARTIINSAPQSAQRFAYTLATQSPTTNPNVITDAAYLTFLRDNWNKLAGYNPNLPEVV
jgi:hypothetical protein